MTPACYGLLIGIAQQRVGAQQEAAAATDSGGEAADQGKGTGGPRNGAAGAGAADHYKSADARAE